MFITLKLASMNRKDQVVSTTINVDHIVQYYPSSSSSTTIIIRDGVYYCPESEQEIWRKIQDAR